MSRVLYDTDKVVASLWLSLLRDFRSRWGENFCLTQELAFRRGIPEFRNTTWSTMGHVDPLYYKARYQMESLLKKYRFRSDLYTDKQLDSITNESYLAFQQSLSAHRIEGTSSYMLLQRARKICSNILGEFSVDEVHNNVRFGRRSSVGCPLRGAYLDNKLTIDEYFTSSTSGGAWFKNAYLPEDHVLRRVVSRALARKSADCPTMHHNYLTLINVPKSYKVHRSITPLTLLDLFYSYGVGKVVQERLKSAGLDIRRLQLSHQRLACRYSATLEGATADLSRASDSITKTLLMRVLPRAWFNAIRGTLTHQIMIDGSLHYTESVLPMGNGFTFPLETLIFYCLIKAVGELTGTYGKFSVYGDDLIYPTRMHKYVAWALPKLHISLNLEKTYASFPFRESCGGDFYRGKDVRPCIISGGHQLLTASKYTAFLYTLHNSVTRRWGDWGAVSSLQLLEQEILRVQGTIFRVPLSYPDTSGIKTPEMPENGDPRFDRVEKGFAHGSFFIRFRWLMTMPRYRQIVCQEAFYWDKLRNRLDQAGDEQYSSQALSIHSPVKRRIESWILPTPQVVWRRKSANYTKRSSRKLYPFTTCREDAKLVSQTSSVSFWA